MAGRRLHLQRYGLTNVNYQYLGAYRFKVVVSDPDDTGADPNVFLFLRHPPDPNTQVVFDEFHAIASPADMVDYPVGEPNEQTTYPFFRWHEVILDFRSISLVDGETQQCGLHEKTWQTIIREIGILLEALDKMDELVLLEEVDVGAPAGESAGSQSSGSSQSG